MGAVTGEDNRGERQKTKGDWKNNDPVFDLNVRQFVTFSSGTDHRRVVVRLLIIDELLRRGVELQFSFDFPGYDSEMTKNRVVMRDFNCRNRVLPTPHTVEPVLDVSRL